MKRKSIYLLGLLTMACAQQSCVDESYDLDNIDKTIGNNIDLTLPTSSTGDIQLKSLMDLEEDGVVQFVTDENGQSIFAVIQDGEADIKDISIDPISFNPDLGTINTTVNLTELGNVLATPKRRVKVKAGDMEINIPDNLEYHYPIQPGTATYKIDENDPNAQSTISEDIISIDKVTFTDNTTLLLTMSIGNFPDWLPEVTLQNLTLQYPKDMTISSCTFLGEPVALSEDGLYHLTDEAGKKVSFADPITLELKLDGVKIGEDGDLQFDPSTHQVRMAGKFDVTGTFRISTSDLDGEAFGIYLENLLTTERNKVLEVAATGSILPVLPAALLFEGVANLGNGITIKNFYGKLQHEVGSIDPITLNDLPDFLNDDEVVLDLDNPIILLKASQGLPVSVNTALTLKAINKARTAPSVTVPLEIGGKDDVEYFYIADKPVANKNILPEEYHNATYIKPDGSISGLIKHIPDEITVDISPITLDASTTSIDLLQSYKVNVEYKVYAPLTLGPDFQLIYRGTENGWSEDLEDFDDINVGEIILTAEAESNLPAAIKLSATPIDENGDEITQLTVNDIVIAPKKTSNITFTLKANTGYTLNDIIAGNKSKGVKQLDGVKYEARIDDANAGASLPEDAYIKLKNIKVRIRGGVSYDAN